MLEAYCWVGFRWLFCLGFGEATEVGKVTESMNRREFLKSAGAVSVTTLLVTQSGLPAKALLSTSQLAVSICCGDKKHSSIDMSSSMLVAGLAAPLIILSSRLLLRTVAGQRCLEPDKRLVHSLNSTNTHKCIDTNKMMRATIIRIIEDNMHQKTRSYFYPVVHEMAQYLRPVLTKKTSEGLFTSVYLLEAPAIIALGAAAKSGTAIVTPADDFGACQRTQNQPQIERSMKYPFVFKTRAGKVEINYRRSPGYKTGNLSVDFQNGKDVLFDRVI